MLIPPTGYPPNHGNQFSIKLPPPPPPPEQKGILKNGGMKQCEKKY